MPEPDRKYTFENKDKAVEAGRKGGKATGLKGMAALKANDPKKFKEVYKKGKRGRPKLTQT